jgi:hypothetical protein
MQARGEMARRLLRAPGQRVLAGQTLGGDAPNAAANFASAFAIAHARVASKALDAVERRLAQAPAVKWIGPPTLVGGRWPLRPAGRGDRRRV